MMLKQIFLTFSFLFCTTLLGIKLPISISNISNSEKTLSLTWSQEASDMWGSDFSETIKANKKISISINTDLPLSIYFLIQSYSILPDKKKIFHTYDHGEIEIAIKQNIYLQIDDNGQLNSLNESAVIKHLGPTPDFILG